MSMLAQLEAATPNGRARLATDDDRDGFFEGPCHVACPASTAETAAVLAVAHAHQLIVTACGRRTKLDWGMPLDKVDLLVDLAGQDALLEHAEGDLVVRAGAGMGLRELNTILARAGQWLPLDEVVAGSSLGGIVATALSGPSRYQHGTVRDLLIGLTVVRMDGRVAHGGSKVVKNVAGYDLAKLFTGSYGTLGIVTEVIFRLRPLEPENRYVTVELDDAAALQQRLGAVLTAKAAPMGIELERAGHDAPITLTVHLAGRSAAIDERARLIAEVLSANAIADERPAWWGALPGPATLKVTTALANLAGLLERIARLASSLGLEVELRGSAGTGVLFVGLQGNAETDAVAKLLEGLRERPLADGSAIALAIPRSWKAQLDLWGPVQARSLMWAVKDRFDPEHRLSPGRFVAGI